MSEEGRSDLGIVPISRPVEEDDRSHVRGELLRQPKAPKCAHGKANDSETFSPHPRMDLKAFHSALDLSAGCFLIEFRHEVFGSVPGRRSCPVVLVGSESNEPSRCEPIA